MILDSSALVALAAREPGYEEVLAKLEAAERLGIGAPTLAETGLVLEARLGIPAEPFLDRFLRAYAVQTIPFDDEHWREAIAAFRRFGRGRHSAALNFGDCLAYATARVAGEPLLFIGADFARTDIDAA